MPGKKLLVADDSLTIQKVIRLALSNEGYDIQAVSDGNDAIQQIALFRPDVVLIDVSLPLKSAFEVKREINTHADLEEVRFVLMSSAFEKVDEVQIEEVQFHGTLTKPFDPAHLRQVLTDVLNQVIAKRMERTSILTTSMLSPQTPTLTPDQQQGSPQVGLPQAEKPLESAPPPPPDANDDEWEEPLQPVDLPTIPQNPQEPLKELWENEPQFQASPPTEIPCVPLPHEPDLASLPNQNEDDIKQLTESTFKEAEEFQWSVNEPSLKPPSNILDSGNSNFDIHSNEALPSTEAKFGNPENVEIPNMKDLLGSPEFFIAGPDSFEVEEPQHSHSSDFVETPADQFDSSLSEIEPPQEITITKPIVPSEPILKPIISEKQIEELVEARLESVLQKMYEKILPDLAEKLIKQEIHKLLSE